MRAAFILLVLLCFISLPKSQVTGHFSLVPSLQRALWAESFDGDNARHTRTHTRTHISYIQPEHETAKLTLYQLTAKVTFALRGACTHTATSMMNGDRSRHWVSTQCSSAYTPSAIWRKIRKNARNAVKNGLKAWHCGKTERLRVSGEHLLSAPPGWLGSNLKLYSVASVLIKRWKLFQRSTKWAFNYTHCRSGFLFHTDTHLSDAGLLMTAS